MNLYFDVKSFIKIQYVERSQKFFSNFSQEACFQYPKVHTWKN